MTLRLEGVETSGDFTVGVHGPTDGLVMAAYLDRETFEIGVGLLEYETDKWIVQPTYGNFAINTMEEEFLPDGLWVVAGQDEMWGAVDKTGQVVIPMEYDSMGYYSQGLAPARKDGEWFYLDTRGSRYEIGLPDGVAAENITYAGPFNDLGVAEIYDEVRDVAYLVADTPVNGVLPAVEGSENIPADVFFSFYSYGDGDTWIDGVYDVQELMPFEQDGKYGCYRLTFDLAGQNPFTDVLPGDYFYDGVLWAADHGIVDTDTAPLRPKTGCPRWKVVESIWRAAGRPEPTVTSVPFTDVSPDAPYYKAILWAYEKNIARGSSATTFVPGETVLRRDALTLLYRAAGEPETQKANGFTDVPDDAYYIDAISWAVSRTTPITNGVTTTTFEPNSPVVNCDVLVLLYRTAKTNAIDISLGTQLK